MIAGESAAVVNRLMAAWETRDVEAISACLAPDAIWHNMPHPPIAGREAISAAIGRFLSGMVAVRFEVSHAGEIASGVVMNERRDVFARADGTEMVIPVAGVFEIRDGLVIAWRDYFDAASAGS